MDSIAICDINIHREIAVSSFRSRDELTEFMRKYRTWLYDTDGTERAKSFIRYRCAMRKCTATIKFIRNSRSGVWKLDTSENKDHRCDLKNNLPGYYIPLRFDDAADEI
ncbi:hypothetical protein I9W82_004435 [Candida metapsilosis]|uniref:Uncharacterized protein n=1 Tax=Candida metapsilosis TaxID=273372 RepID=A0A8H7ZDS4_9ASCO|nr:hypothetical protein I9W82_004435 [Candida metapsilosis]